MNHVTHWGRPESVQRHRRSDVTLGSVFRKDGRLYDVRAIADAPTIEIRDIVSGKTENHVISSLNFSEYEHLTPLARRDGAS